MNLEISNRQYNSKSWSLRKVVLPQHTDHAGVMWHGAYLNWLEEARIDALDQVGLPYSKLSSSGFEMPVVSLKIKYLNSVRHGEEVILESWALPRHGVRWPWHSKFHRINGEIIAEAHIELVLLSYKGEVHHILRHAPDQIDKALKDLQQGPV